MKRLQCARRSEAPDRKIIHRSLLQQTGRSQTPVESSVLREGGMLWDMRGNRRARVEFLGRVDRCFRSGARIGRRLDKTLRSLYESCAFRPPAVLRANVRRVDLRKQGESNTRSYNEYPGRGLMQSKNNPEVRTSQLGLLLAEWCVCPVLVVLFANRSAVGAASGTFSPGRRTDD